MPRVHGVVSVAPHDRQPPYAPESCDSSHPRTGAGGVDVRRASVADQVAGGCAPSLSVVAERPAKVSAPSAPVAAAGSGVSALPFSPFQGLEPAPQPPMADPGSRPAVLLP